MKLLTNPADYGVLLAQEMDPDGLGLTDWRWAILTVITGPNEYGVRRAYVQDLP